MDHLPSQLGKRSIKVTANKLMSRREKLSITVYIAWPPGDLFRVRSSQLLYWTSRRPSVGAKAWQDG